MNGLLKDPMFFYGIAFVIFLVLAYKYARKPVLAWLDGEIQKIRYEVEQSRALRAEAEATLTEYRAKHAAALAEAEGIIAHARVEAGRLKAQAEFDLKDILVKHEQQAAERLRIAEAEAFAEVRGAAIKLAVDLAREMLASQLDDGVTQKLTDQAIADMQKLAASKAKAA